MAAKKTVKKEPTPAALLKKVAAVSDTTKVLAKEIKAMGKIFADNQKVLISIREMIETLAAATAQMQKQSKQINVLEEDTQRLLLVLGQLSGHDGTVARINRQTEDLAGRLAKIEEDAHAGSGKEIQRQVSESADAIKNNSEMIIKVAQRIDEVRDQLRDVAARAQSASIIEEDIGKLREAVQAGQQDVPALKAELERLAGRIDAGRLDGDIADIQKKIDQITTGGQKIDSLGGLIEGLKSQFEQTSARVEALSETGQRLDRLESQISSLSDAVSRSENMASEFNKKTDKLFEQMHDVRGAAGRASEDSSKEMMALLKLSEYQSSMRMASESKYGDASDLENMASQTAQIVNLFDKVSIELQEKIPVPHEVRQWAVAKILDCADRWEIRFSDVLGILVDKLGRQMLKEAIRMRQVREIFGIRAVDELRGELGIS